MAGEPNRDKVVFDAHRGGKIEIALKAPIDDADDLSIIYTPGVGRVSQAIADDVDRSFDFTMRSNAVAIVSDGSAVLGLGEVGPEAALPVMEGKTALFKKFAGIDAFPICIRSAEPSEIVATVKAIAPSFGAVNLEDISAPSCFEVEDALHRELDIPVFHDDQHGTAVVVMAALRNSLKIVGKELQASKVVLSGSGAAGIATAMVLKNAGVADLLAVDSKGVIHEGRDDLNPQKRWLAQNSNRRAVTGGLSEALRDSDVFIGVSSPGILDPGDLADMADDPIIFALANPDPEIRPEDAKGQARIVATGRSDYPNQINNALCFPGFFKGLLEARAVEVNQEMKLAAADALADVVPQWELSDDHIIPSIFDARVVPAISKAVAGAAAETGATRP
ncbi:MAG: NADP-dependent malic enzyme [Actinobacteria bacterium]|nr:NADP-dependent malic enzyme [Actinomycetota bacterium]MDQ3533468.1 NADP-dependent malic enzyme [Actinomycetota bacterium]